MRDLASHWEFMPFEKLITNGRQCSKDATPLGDVKMICYCMPSKHFQLSTDSVSWAICYVGKATEI
jgi:hypothetical protein